MSYDMHRHALKSISFGAILLAAQAQEAASATEFSPGLEATATFMGLNAPAYKIIQPPTQAPASRNDKRKSTKSDNSSDPYARFSKYIPKSFDLPIPGPAVSLAPDPFGLRSSLADAGFGYWAYSLNTYTYDLKNKGHTTGGDQVYAGQKPSYVSYNYIYGTYDLSRYGIENGQLMASVALVYSTWAPAGPTKASVGVLQYYQTLFNNKIELTIGNLANSFTYVGIYVGGNLASGTFGVSASIPSETGLGSTFITRPGVNLKFNLGNGFYDMFGVQRSVNPAGAIAEKKANPSEVTLGGRGVGWLFIDEAGYQAKASAEQMDTWIRGGYSYNNSDYASKRHPGTTAHNYDAYLLADRQLYRVGNDQASRGIYSGFSIMYAPAAENTFSRYYEWRLYDKAPLASRPADMISFVVARNVFSRYSVEAAKRAGLLTDSESTAISLSYSANIMHGVFITGGLSYINNPRPVVTVPEQSPGLNFAVNATFFF